MIETAGYAEHVCKLLEQLLILRLVAAGDFPCDLDIVARGQSGQQIEFLKDKANLGLAQSGALGIAKPGKVDSVDQHATRSRTRKAAKDVEEGRFTAARRPHNADELARRDDKGNVAEGRHIDLACPVYLADVLCLDNGLHVPDCNWDRRGGKRSDPNYFRLAVFGLVLGDEWTESVAFFGSAFSSHHDPDALQHLYRGTGALGQKRICAIGAIESLDASADENRRHFGSYLLHAADEFVSIHVGHDQIAQNQINASFSKKLQCLLAAGGGEHSIAAGFQQEFANGQVLLVVIDA